MSISKVQARVGVETQRDELIQVEVSCLHFRNVLLSRTREHIVVVPFGIATSREQEQALTRYNQYISDYEYSLCLVLYHILRKPSNPISQSSTSRKTVPLTNGPSHDILDRTQ
jgi:hypothetical protein